MKKKLLFLAVCIIGFGIESFSQTVVTLDSIVEGYEPLAYTHTFFIYSNIYDTTSTPIIEKGLLIELDGHIILFDTVLNPDNMVNVPYILIDESLFLPIHNEAFDTVLYFAKTGGTVFFRSYAIIGNDTIYNDTIYDIPIQRVGLKDVSDNNLNCKVYPTIINNYINVDIDNTPSLVRIFDLFGRKVFIKDIYSKSKIDLTLLEKGIYFFRVENKNGYKVFKVIKK